jgi:hypothetical protein
MMIVNNHAGGMNMSIDELFENVIAGPERYYAAVADGSTVIVYREIIDDDVGDRLRVRDAAGDRSRPGSRVLRDETAHPVASRPPPMTSITRPGPTSMTSRTS